MYISSFNRQTVIKKHTTMHALLTCAIIIQVVAGQQPASQDSWGEWSKWTDCSRTCGGGVTKSFRECIRPSNVTTNVSCSGSDVRFQMCNIQDCPDNSVDFRMLQCSNFNKKSYKGKYYKWAGFSHSAGECELKCMPKGEFFYVTFDQKVADGTRCNDFSQDVCINGGCVAVGCDMQLYSKARVDNCGLCNGDDSKCRQLKSSFKLGSDAYGYVDVVTVPAGATSIRITEDYKTTNFLAVTSNGKNILNADYAISSSFGTRKYRGHVIKYERSQRLNQIKIDGPIDLPIQFHVYVARHTKRPIIYKYEYYMPRSYHGNVNTVQEYNWIIGDWSKCSKKCAHGKRTRIVYCARKNTQTKVEDFNCDNEKPIVEEDCATQPCPARWYISQWSACSKSCGKGFHTRRVHCVETVKDGNVKMLKISKCPGKTPAKVAVCYKKRKCPEWQARPWQKCSKSCGNGVQNRKVYCVRDGDVKVHQTECPIHEKPVIVQECHNFPCGAQWVAEKWSQCSSHCGIGMRHRKVTCNNRAGVAVPGTHCNPRDEPKHFDDCQVVGPCKPMWHSSQWSKCSAKCGYGMQIRMVTCAELNGSEKFIIADEKLCNSQNKPIAKRKCAETKPCQVNYFVSKWGECSVSCGAGFRTRDVRCYADRRVDYSEKHCANVIKPTAVAMCNKRACGEEGGATRKADKPGSENDIDSVLGRFTTTADPLTSTDPAFTVTDVVTSTAIATTTATTATTTTKVPVTKAILTKKLTNPTGDVKPTFGRKTSKVTKPKAPKEDKYTAATIVSFTGPTELTVNTFAKFYCIVDGYPTPGIFWSYDGRPVNKLFSTWKVSKNIVGNRVTSKLVLRSSQVAAVKDLKCFARNRYGLDASVLRIKIAGRPEVTSTTKAKSITKVKSTTKDGKRRYPAVIESFTGPVDVNVNEEAGYRCVARGYPAPNVYWSFGGNRVDRFFDTFKLATDTRKDGKVVNRLMVQSAEVANGKELRCTVSNSHGRDSKGLILKIIDPLATTSRPVKITKPVALVVTVPQEATVGTDDTPAIIVSLSGPVKLESDDNADYQCIAGGRPAPTITWTLNGKPLDAERFRILTGPTGSRLVVLRAKFTDTGILRCIAKNKLASDQSKLSIKVSGVPLVSIYPKQSAYKEGNQVTITCQAEGSPTPTIQWGKDGRIFFGDNKRVIVLQDRIIFKGILPRDSGKYFCKGYNSQGTNIDQISVTIERNDGTRISTCEDDNSRADCRLIASLSRLCSIPHYNSVCCETCRGRV